MYWDGFFLHVVGSVYMSEGRWLGTFAGWFPFENTLHLYIYIYNVRESVYLLVFI